MKYLFIILLLLSLSACSLFKDIPAVEDIQKTIKQVETNLTIVEFANDQLYSAGLIDDKEYENNEIIIGRIKGNLKGVKMLLSLQKDVEANDILKSIQKDLNDLNKASSRQ